MYFLNHVLNYFMDLVYYCFVYYCCNDDAIWRFVYDFRDSIYIRVAKIEPRDNILNMHMIL